MNGMAELLQNACERFFQIFPLQVWGCAASASLKSQVGFAQQSGAEITLEMKNDSGTAYEHCELSVNGEGFWAIGEAKNARI